MAIPAVVVPTALQEYFITKCPLLSPVQSYLLSNIPAAIAPYLPGLETDPVWFTKVMVGLEWIKDTPTQTFTIPHSPTELGTLNLPK